MKLKKFFNSAKLMAIPFLCFSLSCNAQSVSNEIMNGTKWETPQKNPNVKVYLSFTKKTITETLLRLKNNTRRDRTYNYYFTDEFPTKFDKKKVGKPNEGKYICFYIPEQDLMVVQIYELPSPDTLCVRSSNPNASPDDKTFHLRVK